MSVATEQFTNLNVSLGQAQTTLSGNGGSITAGATSLKVAAFTGFPAAAQYRILIENELLIVTAGAGTTTWTVTRGAEGTTAASHNDGATVTHILTAGGLQAVCGQTVLSDIFANLPAAGVVGKLYMPTDGAQLLRDNGTSFIPWGPISPLVQPNDASFSWTNQGGASVDTTHGGIYLLAPASASTNFRIRTVAYPAGTFTLSAHITPIGFSANFWNAGLIFLDNTGANVAFEYDWSTHLGLSIDKYTNTFGFVAAYGSGFPTYSFVSDMPGMAHWLRIQNDGTNLKFYVSFDGNFWLLVESHSNTDYITPTKIGYFANSVNASHDCGIRLLSWNITSP